MSNTKYLGELLVAAFSGQPLIEIAVLVVVVVVVTVSTICAPQVLATGVAFSFATLNLLNVPPAIVPST
jgi:hypothetical protein